MAAQLLHNYTKQVFESAKNKGWDGTFDRGGTASDKQWSFAGSLLFAITVITTIGKCTASLRYRVAHYLFTGGRVGIT